MKVSKIVVVLAIALAAAAVVVPASAWFGPFGGIGCGFGFSPFGTVATSSFTSTSTFSTTGAAGFGFSPFGIGCGVPFGVGGFGLGGFGVGGCGLGLGGFGFSPFGFC